MKETVGKTTKMVTVYKTLHPKAEKNKVHIKRKEDQAFVS